VHPLALSRSQGTRVKKSRGNETCEEVIVPGGDLAFGAEGAFGITVVEIAGQATMTRTMPLAGSPKFWGAEPKIVASRLCVPQSGKQTAFAVRPIQ
jgi:hypothetical protein